MLKGIFIGIDRHASTKINWLSCARRDAAALHALFSDTLGGENRLLLDADATRDNIKNAIQGLSSCNEDDIVVVTFSGHGTETHEIVSYDADVADLGGTCIPVSELGDWLSRIPARNLLLVLDCCFSGGMGTKGLTVEAIPRDLPSTDSLLDQLSGSGRVILTASSATEPAWEITRFRHGLLTHYLLEALQGAAEVVDAGKLSVYRLMEYVTKRVIDSAAIIGKLQHPSLRGSFEGQMQWPVFRRGSSYYAAFPDRTEARAAANLQSLANFGFPPALIASWARSIPSLNQLQVEAINDYKLLEGEHLVVSAPTSSGKTLIGELAAVQGALERKRAFFLFPLKALVNDKWRHFAATYGDFGLRTIRVTGDSTADEIVPLMRGQYDICLLTYEKCAALLLGNPFLLEQVGTVVIDEVQMIADRSRGVNLEFLLTLLRMRRRTVAEPQVIALSAVIGSTNGFERWIGGRLLLKTERPVPLDEGLLRADGSFRYVDAATGAETTVPFVTPEYRKGSSQDLIVPLARKLVAEGKSVIVFRETKGFTRGCAAYLADSLGLPPANAALQALPEGDPSSATQELRAALQRGVGFHMADLTPDERQVIEEEFRLAKELRVLAATTTLAMGINTPAEAVIIAGLEHPGNEPYSVAEYKNIVGRAGRLGLADRGTSFLIALTPNDEHYLWNRYVQGLPEPITPQFLEPSSDVRSLMLRIVATAEGTHSGMVAEDIIGFIEESFAAFLQKQQSPTWALDRPTLERALNELTTHHLLERDEKAQYHLTELGRVAGVSGTEVESIIRIIDALQPLRVDEITDPALIAATQLTVELDAIPFPLNKRSTQKEPQTWFGELQRQAIAQSLIRWLNRSASDHHTPTLRAKKAVSCLLWISGLEMAEIEARLTQFGGAFDGAAGPVRAVKARTCDLLPTVARVAELLKKDLVLDDRVERLLIRLELGLPASAVPLARLVSDRLDRGNYLRLLNAGLMSPEAISNASDEAILQCVGGRKGKCEILQKAAKDHQAEVGKHTQAAGAILPPYEG